MRVGIRTDLVSAGIHSDEERQRTPSNGARRLPPAENTLSAVEFGTIQIRDEDKPYKKRLAMREQGSSEPSAYKSVVAAQSSSVRQRSKSNVEKDLWHCSQQRREEFKDLLSTYNPSLSGPGFLRVIRNLTDAAAPLTNVQLPTERNDIRLFRIRVPGHGDDVYVLRRDIDGELRDLRRLQRPGDGNEMRGIMAQMEKSAFQSHGVAAAARGKSMSYPHQSKLWQSTKRKQEFQTLYTAYRQLPGKLDVTGGHFLDALYKLTIEAEKRGSAQNTNVADIRLFTIRVPGTPAPVQVLRRLDTSGSLADIRLTSQTSLEETLDQMSDSRRNAGSAFLSAPRRDRCLQTLWKRHLAPQLASELERFRRAQPDESLADAPAFIRHLDQLCDKNPGDIVDRRFGISRHVITPLGSSQPITVLRRKLDSEQIRIRAVDNKVIDNLYAERAAMRSLRSIGPKRKQEVAVSTQPSKRRKILTQQNHQPRKSSAPAQALGQQVHRITVQQQYKDKTVDVTHLVTGAVGRISGGPRTLETTYANSPALIRAPHSYADNRERQVLRWLSSVLLKAFPGGREVQAYYDRASDEIWISSNARGTNRKIRMLLNENGLQGELQKQLQAGKVHLDMNDRWLRHATQLEQILNDRSVWPPDANPVLQAITAGRFRVSSENFHFTGGGRQIDLHAERRIKQAFENETGRMLESNRIVGTKRPCGTCAEALQFSDDQHRGPFWQTKAAHAFIDTKSAINSNVAKGIPTYISRNRSGELDLNVSDSDSDA